MSTQTTLLQNERITVLIAEDQEPNYIFLKDFLEEYSCKVLLAKNGDEAVKKCREDETISVVLMDIKMPVMDGYTAAKLIKSFRPNLPIIAQTAYATRENIEKFGYVFDDYLTKPFSSELLATKINNNINRK